MVAIFLHVVASLLLFTAAYEQHEEYPPYDHGFNVQLLVRRQMAQPIVVTRLPSVNGSVPFRPEIRQMKRDAPRWNLFLLALSMMQQTDQEELLSWYQITGIHGVPFVPWNGVQPAQGSENHGYCAHMSILFPTWHRPYLALYEQALFHLAQMIASWFHDPAERLVYQAAAANFRIPYWDWALTPPPGESAFLPEFRRPAVEVYGPNGQQLIANPLFSYRFRPLDSSVFAWGDFPSWTETKRSPSGNISNNEMAGRAVDRILPSLQARLFNLFSNYPEYGPFSNKLWGETTGTAQYDSLESLHDEIHIEVGNGGHLYYIQYSAFDPLFFLHHAMADRIVAMWQALHPASWVTEQNTTVPTFTMEAGSVQNNTTPLTPFLSSPEGIFWTSETVRYTRAFGYSYAETSKFDAGINPARYTDERARLILLINRLYGSWSLSALARKRKRNEEREEPHSSQGLRWSRWLRGNEPGETGNGNPNSDWTSGPVTSERTLSTIAADNTYTEWLANIHVMNGAVNGSFSVDFYLGDPPRKPTPWRLAPNLIGSLGVFTASGVPSKHRISGTVPLTSSLLHMVSAGSIDGLHPGDVVPFLKENLQFQLSGHNGLNLDPNLAEGLCIEIVSSDVLVAIHDWELPVWGPVQERLVMFC